MAAAVGVVSSRVAVHSALFLLDHFVTLAILYITLDAQFLGAAQVIVYAGGIVILILFVIMLIGSANGSTRAPAYRTWVPYAGIALGVILVAGTRLCHSYRRRLMPATLPANQGGVPEVVGMYLYTPGHSACGIGGGAAAGGAARRAAAGPPAADRRHEAH